MSLTQGGKERGKTLFRLVYSDEGSRAYELGIGTPREMEKSRVHGGLRFGMSAWTGAEKLEGKGSGCRV